MMSMTHYFITSQTELQNDKYCQSMAHLYFIELDDPSMYNKQIHSHFLFFVKVKLLVLGQLPNLPCFPKEELQAGLLGTNDLLSTLHNSLFTGTCLRHNRYTMFIT